MPLRVYLVEDHPFTRDGLRAALRAEGLEVVGEAGSAEEALEAVPRLHPDVVVMDLGLPGLDGIEATRRLKALCPGLKVVVLTVQGAEAAVRAALASGAQAYCLKTGDPKGFLLAVRAAALGSVYLDPPIARLILGGITPPEAAALSEREREILRLIARGLSNKAIARTLGISPSTVKTHVESLLAKLQASDRTEAAVKALREGLI